MSWAWNPERRPVWSRAWRCVWAVLWLGVRPKLWWIHCERRATTSTGPPRRASACDSKPVAALAARGAIHRVASRHGLLASLALLGAACVRPPAHSSAPSGPTRLAVLDPDYGAAADHPEAIGLDEPLEALALALADGGSFELDEALAAGPVVLVWIGGAEHEALSAWIRGLDRGLLELEQRGATLVFVRPLGPEGALRWATELRLQAVVAGDPDGALAALLDARRGPEEPAAKLEFAALIISEGIVAYRKLGGRRPELAELLAVLDGEATNLRCCLDPCPDPCGQP